MKKESIKTKKVQAEKEQLSDGSTRRILDEVKKAHERRDNKENSGLTNYSEEAGDIRI